MLKKPLTILAINPGTSYLGIAIFQGSELRDWRIKVFKGKWSKEKMDKIKSILLGLIDQYNPNILAIKRLNPSRTSSNLNKLTSKIKDICQMNGLKVYQYSIKEVEAFFSPDEKINKKKLTEIIASEYPILFFELNREKAHKNPYYIRMFEAVALGSVCFYQLDKHH